MESLERTEHEAVIVSSPDSVSSQEVSSQHEDGAPGAAAPGSVTARGAADEFVGSSALIERLEQGNRPAPRTATNGSVSNGIPAKASANGAAAHESAPVKVPFAASPFPQHSEVKSTGPDGKEGESADQKTLRERIVDGLREAIVLGEIAPGARLQEVEIAERYHTSRTPVREAFRQLESEGFVRIRARRGAVVTSMTAKDVREFYDIKSVLEGYAARCAAARLTDREIDRMEKLNEELDQCYAQGNVARVVQVHNEFHEAFVRACGNDRLVQLITGLVQQFQRFRIALSHTEAVRDSVELHREIIAAFRARDTQRVEELVARNSLEGSEFLIQGLLAPSGE